MGAGEDAPRILLGRLERQRDALAVQVDVEDLDGGPGYPVITGDYSGFPRWEPTPVTVGTPIAKPSPVFVKLDAEEVVATERAAMSGEG